MYSSKPNQTPIIQTENSPTNPQQPPTPHKNKNVLLIGIITGIFLLILILYPISASFLKKQALSTKQLTIHPSPTLVDIASPTQTSITTNENTILNPADAAKNPDFAFTDTDKNRLETGYVSQNLDIALSILTENLKTVVENSESFTLFAPPNSTLLLNVKTLAIEQYVDDGPIFGSVVGILTRPGDQPKKILLGLKKEKGVWLMTIAEYLPDN